MKKSIRWLAGIFLFLVLLIVIASFFVEEPLRKHIQQRMNSELKGYTVTITSLDFHPIGFSLDLEGITVIQAAHPSPPVAEIGEISASVHWRKLLNARLVADFLIDAPRVYLNPENLAAERKDKRAVHKKGWQDALQSAYPLKMNQLAVRDGDLVYVMQGELKPLRLNKIEFKAGNIRNIDYEEETYPSGLNLNAVVFEKGSLSMTGNANFLMEPHPGFKGRMKLDQADLGYIAPIAAKRNIDIKEGIVSLEGGAEYSPKKRSLVLQNLLLKELRLDYVHRSETAEKEKERAKKTKEAARELADKPKTLLKIEQLKIDDGTIGFINRAKQPDYRVFFNQINLTLENFSNHFSEGPAKLVMKSVFMGSGPSSVYATFRSEKDGPDFDLKVAIDKTPMVKMNDLFRAYGNFDVTAGQFSFFSELEVRNQQIQGYIKPLFENMKVYDRRQDKEKGLFRKLYEKIVGGLAELLENPREETATKTEVTGELEDPETNTWQVIVNLVRNAFFRSILPGFEENVKS